MDNKEKVWLWFFNKKINISVGKQQNTKYFIPYLHFNRNQQKPVTVSVQSYRHDKSLLFNAAIKMHNVLMYVQLCIYCVIFRKTQSWASYDDVRVLVKEGRM